MNLMAMLQHAKTVTAEALLSAFVRKPKHAKGWKAPKRSKRKARLAVQRASRKKNRDRP